MAINPYAPNYAPNYGAPTAAAARPKPVPLPGVANPALAGLTGAVPSPSATPPASASPGFAGLPGGVTPSVGYATPGKDKFGNSSPITSYIPPGDQYAAEQALVQGKQGIDAKAALQAEANKATAALAAQTGVQNLAEGTQANTAATAAATAKSAADLETQRRAEAATAGLQTSAQGATAAAQAAELASRGQLQTSAQTAALGQQTQAEKAAAGLQAAGFGGEQGLAAQRAALLASGHASDAELNAAAEKRRIGEIPGILSSLTGGAPPVGYGGGAPGAGGPSVNSAQDAAFAREKDRIGKLAASGLTSLRDSLGSRGMLGGGLEAGGTADILGTGQEELGNTVRQQTEDQLAAQQHIQDQIYQGNIAQRGQNFNLAPSLLGLIGAGRTAY